QLSSHLIGNWRGLQFIFPGIDQPHARRFAELCAEIKSVRAARIFEAVSERNLRRRASPFLIFESVPVQADQFKKPAHETVGKRNLEVVGTLWPHDSLAIHVELVTFGLAAEHWVIIEDETIQLRAAILFEKQGCGKSADTSADDHAVVYFAGVDGVSRQCIEGTVANLVPGGHHFKSVAV